MKVTYFGTTTLLFDDGKDQIFFDAHFTMRTHDAVDFDALFHFSCLLVWSLFAEPMVSGETCP